MGGAVPGARNWGSEVEAALSVVLAAEATVFRSDTAQASTREFLRFHRWLIAVDALPHFLRGHSGTGEKLVPADLLVSALAKGAGFMGWTGRIASRADAILFKSNLRAFYPSREITIKTSNPVRIASHARVAHEAAARKRLLPGRYMRAPTLIADGELETAAYLAEQWVEGRKRASDSALAASLAVDLVDFHLRNGIASRCLGDLLELPRAWAGLQSWAADLRVAITPKLKQRIGALLGGAFDRHRVLTCLCNGDLAASNLLIASETTFVMDWEWAFEAPVFVDAVKLSVQIDGFAEAFLNAVRLSDLASAAKLLDLGDQFLLAGLLVAGNRISRQGDFRSPKDEQAYARRLASSLTDFIRLMEMLARRSGKYELRRFGSISRPERADPGLWRYVH